MVLELTAAAAAVITALRTHHVVLELLALPGTYQYRQVVRARGAHRAAAAPGKRKIGRAHV